MNFASTRRIKRSPKEQMTVPERNEGPTTPRPKGWNATVAANRERLRLVKLQARAHQRGLKRDFLSTAKGV